MAVALGDWSLFASRALGGVVGRAFTRRELLRIAVEVGANSVGVIAITGTFIGMVLAVQAYGQFHTIGLETSLGAVIHLSVVRELGPVLAAVMLAGRIGSAMAAEMATMRVTEQLDALASLGVDPVKYLAAPRVLACVLLLPLLTVLADVMGLVGSSLICLRVYGIDDYHYWRHTREFVKVWDVMAGQRGGVRRGAVADRLPPRVQQPPGGRGRRPRRHRGVRRFVHRDPHDRLRSRHARQHRLLSPVAARVRESSLNLSTTRFW
jgi:phospholipid/cholesterol/gamma-HCH transport system permease protein